MAAQAILMGGSMGLQAWSGIQQAQMIRQQARLTERINDLNAKYAEIDAYEAEKFGLEEAQRYETQVQQVSSSQRTAMAAADVDTNYGTAKDLLNESKLNGFLNVIDLQQKARQRAAGVRREAGNIRLQGYMSSLQSEGNAAAAQMSGIVGAVSTGANYASRKGASGYSRG